MSFLSAVRDASAQATNQAIAGQRLNQELDQAARNHWGNQAYDATVNAISHAKAAFNAEELRDNFEFFRTGDMTLSLPELHKIAERRYPGDPNDPNVSAERDFYVANFMNSTGWSGVDLGDWTKAYGAVNYDPVSGQMVNSRVITPDVQHRNVYSASRTEGGVPVAEGGQPINVAVDGVYDQKMRGYLRNAISSAQIDPNAFNVNLARLFSLQRTEDPVTGDPAARGLKVDTDPNVNIERVDRTPDRQIPGQALDALGRRVITGQQPVGQQPVGQQPVAQQPGAAGQVSIPAANPNLDFDLGDTASYFETEGTGPDGTDGAYNPWTERPYSVQTLQQIYNAGPEAVVQQLGGDDFVYEEGSIPWFNREQWEGYSEGQRESIIREAKTRSVSNIDRAMSTLQRSFNPRQPPLPDAQVEALQRQGTNIDYLLEDRITFSDQYGAPEPFEGKTPEETMEAIKTFYTTNLSDESPSYGEKTGIQEPSLQQVMLNHPRYFDQFQALGPAEFARQYMEDPEFAKSMPTRAEQARRRRELTNLSNHVLGNPDNTNLPSRNDITEIISQSFSIEGGAKSRVFKDELGGIEQLTTPQQDTIAAYPGQIFDANIGEADLTAMSMSQRGMFGFLLMAGMSPDERTVYGPNVESMITTGVMKSVSDQWPTMNEQAQQASENRLRSIQELNAATDIARLAVQAETADKDRELDRMNIARGIQGDQVNVWRDIYSADAARTQHEAEVAHDEYLLSRQTAADAHTYRNSLMEQLPKGWDRSGASDPGWHTFESGFPGGESMDIFTFGASLPSGTFLQNQVKDLVNSPQFAGALNTLAQWNNMGTTKPEFMALSTTYTNALKVILRGASQNDLAVWSIPSWGREIMEFARGKVPRQGGDLGIDFDIYGYVGADDHLSQITDPSQLYHPGYHRDGVKPARIVVKSGGNQKGIDVTPGSIKFGHGNLLWSMILAQATENASMGR